MRRKACGRQPGRSSARTVASKSASCASLSVPSAAWSNLTRPGGRGHLCGTCLSTPPSYDLARSLVRYETAVRQLIHKLKFGGDTSVAGALGDLAQQCRSIPFCRLSRSSFRYPCIACGCGRVDSIRPWFLPGCFSRGGNSAIRPDGLIRIRNTVAQTELRGIDRRKNLKNAFQLNASFQPDRSIVCLVDDVFTTGTTVEACSRVLKNHGAREVRVITLARASMTGGSR